MMDIDKIKQKILDLAIRGKLVPQDPNDEPASVLVEKIKAEKEKMVKEGKIKPSKDDSYIYKDSDNCYYENFGGKWAYVPLEALATIIMGQSPNGSDISTENGKGALEFHQGKISFTDWQIDKSGKFAINFNKVAPENSLLVCVRAPVGEVNFTNRKIAIGRGLCAIKPNTSLLDTKYLYYVLLDLKKYFLKKGKGSTFDAITVDVLKHCIIPLPSINYQRRIASVLDEGFSLLNYINRSQEEISNLAMIIKTKILDHFFGENSSYKSYYEKGVTKATQLSTVCKLYTGNSISKENKAKKYTFSEMIGLPYIGTKDVKTNNSIDYNNGVYIPPADQNDFAIAPKNSILLCIEGGSAGRKIAITNQNLCFGNKLCCFAPKGVETQYLFYFLQSNQFKRFFTKNTSGIIGGVSINKLRKIQINLPHYEEQQKIARLITKIFGNLNSIYE